MFRRVTGTSMRAATERPVIHLHLQNGTRIHARLEGGDAALSISLGTEGSGGPTREAALLRQIEGDSVRGALDAERGNVSAAARRLGIARTTLYRKLRQRRTAVQQSAKS